MLTRDQITDDIIEALAEAECLLRARVASLEADVRTYREPALAALDAVHDMTRERDRHRKRVHRLVEEIRALRAEHRKAAA